ncbi:hypothetical protein [Paludibacterium denitrificans]|uniref:hypothetical protein n=1 Tax=Paludibacterium denitrificans TaxID=2675226 RepID=UPI001E49961E|nr:hypothetical protein [Paludibacterium denitrificans]
MKIIKFLKPYALYTSSDIAGFDDDKADKLIEAKIAEAYEAPADDKADKKSAKD